ncbi:MAG: chaperonin GroEL [Caldilinea sp. CFX5]|nr:chaperonin GroEL [Caldilinea sp. CFX5]
MTNLRSPSSTGKQNLPGFRTPKTAQRSSPRAAIVTQPQVYQDLQQGVDAIMAAIRPTLGPSPRLVALARSKGNEAPEILDDGALIARRIIQITPRGADVGAMLLRHALWRMHQEVGDGATTMAVIYQALLNEGVRVITQGGCNAMLLRAGLEKGLQAVQESLQHMARPLVGKAAIARFACGLVQGNCALAELLGEIFDIVGADGLVVVEKGNRLGLEREYIEGTYWHLSGWVSRHFVTDTTRQQTTFEDAALLISDLAIEEPEQLIPVLEQCAKAGVRRLVITAKSIADRAVGLLVQNNQAKTVSTLVVRTPRVQEADQVAAMEDIAALTGGRVFYAAATADFQDFQIADLGYARRAWATQSLFGLFGGKGDPRQLRHHIRQLRGQLKSAVGDHEQQMLRERLGRMTGGTAILRVADATDTSSAALKTLALRAVTTLRHALTGGVVAGGGTALLQAQQVLSRLPAASAEEAIAYNILGRALEEPLRTIAHNAGYHPTIVTEQVQRAPAGCVFDARSGQLVNIPQSGIQDALFILQKALTIAVSGAAQALTTDAIVHHRKPPECIEP